MKDIEPKPAPKHTFQPFEIKPIGEFYYLPHKAKDGSIGYDIVAPVDFVVPAYSRCHLPLNISINLPRNIEGKIEPRSGFSLRGMEGYGKKRVYVKIFGFIPWHKTISGKQSFDADVLTGKIDPGYTDNINVIIKNNDEQFIISRGTRIAQITFYKVISPEFIIVDKLSCSSRGGGLGSSGTMAMASKTTFRQKCSRSKNIPFSEYYATRTPKERATIDEFPSVKAFNSKAKENDRTCSN